MNNEQVSSNTPYIHVTVDTSCSVWNICVHDSSAGGGIKSINLLNDPYGNFVKPARSYYNARLDDSLDPSNTNQIFFSGRKADLCFKVLVNKTIDSAYAPIFIADSMGNFSVLDLQYYPPLVKLTPDSGRYFLSALGKDTCSRFVFYNKGKTGGKSFLFTSDNLKSNSPDFSITSTIPALPVTIRPGDSLAIMACFTPRDTMPVRDTIELANDCFTIPIDLAGSGSTPLIIADDHDFGAVIVDSTKCASVGIKNVGTASLVLTKQWLMDNYGVNFSFPDQTKLPIEVKPGQKTTVDICYTPHAEHVDSTIMHWGTNLLQPYLHSIKDSSIFRGIGVKAGFIWDRTQQVFLADSTIADDTVIQRIFLYNSSRDLFNGPTVHVGKVFLSGSDPFEFYILDDQLHHLPLENFYLSPGDSIWVDVVFKPDMTKGYHDRHAQLVAQAPTGEQKDQIVNLLGTWAKSGVNMQSAQKPFTIYPNPVTGNSVTVVFSSTLEKNGSLIFYDVLGREVFHNEVSAGAAKSEIPVRDLNPGTYYLRCSSELGVVTQKLEILER